MADVETRAIADFGQETATNWASATGQQAGCFLKKLPYRLGLLQFGANEMLNNFPFIEFIKMPLEMPSYERLQTTPMGRKKRRSTRTEYYLNAKLSFLIMFLLVSMTASKLDRIYNSKLFH